MTRLGSRAHRMRVPIGRRARAFRVLLLLVAVGVLGSLRAWADPGPRTPGLLAGPTPAQGQEPGSELRVWLITVGPGTAVWERFGHNALRVVDTRTGYDASYNWGIFDFNQVDFIPRFLKGQMLYMMAPFQSEAMIQMYRSAGREVLAQELDLSPAQKLELRDFAERNALPENRDYFYDYFLDNCSTRVRDLLDRVLGGALFAQFGSEDTGTSYRFHTRRLTRPDPLLFTGMDILLGSPGDRPITRWAEMFVPMTLRDAVREVRVDHGDGRARALVLREEVLADARGIPEPREEPTWWPWYLALGTLGGVGLALLGRRASRGGKAWRMALAGAGALWGATAGLAGVILVAVLFTDHSFMTWNENLFLLSPLSLGIAVLAPLAVVRPTVRSRARVLAALVTALGVVGVMVGVSPWAVQQNGMEIGLFLPLHLGLWQALKELG